MKNSAVSVTENSGFAQLLAKHLCWRGGVYFLDWGNMPDWFLKITIGETEDGMSMYALYDWNAIFCLCLCVASYVWLLGKDESA